MALPVPVKTWNISANNAVPSNVGPADPLGRTKDLADFWCTVVDQLLLLDPINITVAGSSDGVSNVSPPVLPSANYWTYGNTDFRTRIYNYFAFGGGNSMWIVLNIGTSQLALTFNSSDATFSAYWSPGANFAAPVFANRRPEATVDERQLAFFISGNIGYQAYGVFNKDNQGIINTSNSYLNYTQQIHVGLASDYSGFYAVSFRSQVPAMMVWFGTLQNAVYTTPPYDWSAAKVMFLSGNQSFTQVTGYFSDSTGSGWQPRSSLDTNGVFFTAPAIPANGFNIFNGGLYGSVANNAIMYNATVDLDTLAYPIANIGLYSPTRYGLKGSLTDLWWGPGNGNTYTYPASSPLTPSFFQANDLIFPWDGVTAINFA